MAGDNLKQAALQNWTRNDVAISENVNGSRSERIIEYKHRRKLEKSSISSPEALLSKEPNSREKVVLPSA